MQQNPLAALLGGQNPRSAQPFGAAAPNPRAALGANPMVANVINQRQKKRKLRSASKESVVKAKGGMVPGQNAAFKHPPVGPNKVTRY